jgi:hypothetical protein
MSKLKVQNLQFGFSLFGIWILEFGFSSHLVVVEKCEMFWQMRKVFFDERDKKLK